jgi:hypothetical protein
VDVSTKARLCLCAGMLAGFLLACARDSSAPASACEQSRQRPRSFELAKRCALEEAGLRPDSPEAEQRLRAVAQRFLTAGITPEDVAPEKWAAMTRTLRKPARPAARKKPPSSIPEATTLPEPERSRIAARTERIIQERLESAPEAELFLAIAYGQIPHERAREPLIQRGLVREKHRDDVRSGNIAVGMSDLEVVLSQGRVADIHTVKGPSGVRRQLLYGEPDALVVTEDGFVTSWQAGAPSEPLPQNPASP